MRAKQGRCLGGVFLLQEADIPTEFHGIGNSWEVRIAEGASKVRGRLAELDFSSQRWGKHEGLSLKTPWSFVAALR